MRAFAIFPFVTSLSDLADQSTIQKDSTELNELIWNGFRKLVWLDRSLDRSVPALSYISEKFCDDELRLLGVLFGAMVSERFVYK